MKVEFISYDGAYPNLCSGQLILKVDEETYNFPAHSMSSGGNVSFDENWSEEVTSGPWSIYDWPNEFPENAKELAIEIINENVQPGCCGGCV